MMKLWGYLSLAKVVLSLWEQVDSLEVILDPALLIQVVSVAGSTFKELSAPPFL